MVSVEQNMKSAENTIIDDSGITWSFALGYDMEMAGIKKMESAESPPTVDSGFEWFHFLILIPIVFGVYLIQHFRKKSRKKEKQKM